MLETLPRSPTPQNTADVYTATLLGPAAEQVAGKDGRVSAGEAAKNQFVEHAYEATGHKKPTIKSVVQTGRTAMLQAAVAASGGDGRVSSADAKKMPLVLAQAFAMMRAAAKADGPAATGTLSPLFPQESALALPLSAAWLPAGTDKGAIEDDAHVVNYTTADGRHSCELWWMGGDAGTPLLAYLADATGTFYIPELSQPKEAGLPAFASVQEAATRFATLAEARYAAVEAVQHYFDRYDFSAHNLGQESLPHGQRIDARPGRAERALVPQAVLEAFDWYYEVEDRDLGGVSLHRGEIDGHACWAVFTTTDGDPAFLEVFDAAGTPLCAGRVWADSIAYWDDAFGRGRNSDFVAVIRGVTNTDGFSEPAERLAAGQIPIDWRPDVVVGETLVEHDGLRLTNAVLASEPRLAPLQKLMAHAAIEALWEHVLRDRADASAPELPVKLGKNGTGELRLGTFVNQNDRVRYLVADYKDVDDSSFTFYFKRVPTGVALAIEQYNN